METKTEHGAMGKWIETYPHRNLYPLVQLDPSIDIGDIGSERCIRILRSRRSTVGRAAL